MSHLFVRGWTAGLAMKKPSWNALDVDKRKRINFFASKCKTSKQIWGRCTKFGVVLFQFVHTKSAKVRIEGIHHTWHSSKLRFFVTPLPGARSRLKLRWTRPRHGQKMPAQNSTGEAKKRRSQVKKTQERFSKEYQKTRQLQPWKCEGKPRSRAKPVNLCSTGPACETQNGVHSKSTKEKICCYDLLWQISNVANTEGSGLSCRWPQDNVQLKSSILRKHWCSITVSRQFHKRLADCYGELACLW